MPKALIGIQLLGGVLMAFGCAHGTRTSAPPPTSLKASHSEFTQSCIEAPSPAPKLGELRLRATSELLLELEETGPKTVTAAPALDIEFGDLTVHSLPRENGWHYVVFESPSHAVRAEFRASKPILSLDRSHFAVLVEVPGAQQAPQHVIEVWQTHPLERVHSIVLPTRKRISEPRMVRTTPLPHPAAPRPPNPPAALHKTFVSERFAQVPTPLAFERGPDAEVFEVRSLSAIEGGLISVGYHEAQSLVDWHKGRVVLHLPCSRSNDPVLSGDERWVAFGCGKIWLGVYDRQKDESRIMTAPGLAVEGRPALFSPDGRSLVSGGEYELGFLWDSATGKLLHTLPEPFPWVAAGLLENATSPIQFVREGREVFILGKQLRRFDVASGRELPVPKHTLSSQSESLSIVERKDRSLAFVNGAGCLIGEVTSDNQVLAHSCETLGYNLIGVHPHGEWFARTSDNPRGVEAELLATRGGQVLWRVESDDPRNQFTLSSDANELRGSNGERYSIPEGRQLRPGRQWTARGVPELEGEVIRFASGTTVDLGQGRAHFEDGRFRGRTPKKHDLEDCDDDEDEDFPGAMRALKPCFRKAKVYCHRDRAEMIATHEDATLGKRSGCDRLLGMSEDGALVALQTKHGLRLWKPVTGEEEPLLEKADVAQVVRQLYFGPHATVLAVTNDTNISLFNLKTGALLWRDTLQDGVGSLEFSLGPDAGRLRVTTNSAIIGWDLRSGRRVEQWPSTCSYRPLRDGLALVFLCENEVQVVMTSTLQPLFSLANRAPNSLIVKTPDGRFEILGERKQAAPHLRCSENGQERLLSACRERFERTGLFREVHREFQERTGVPVVPCPNAPNGK